MRAIVLIDNITKNEWKAEWGLAVYIEYDGHKILLDAGTTGAFAENADAMGIDLSQVEFGVLSHAHYDHADGLAAFFERNQQAKFYLRAGSEENCYKQESDTYRYIGIHEGYLNRFAERISYVEGDFSPVPGVTLVPHKTEGLKEIGRKAHMYVWKNGGWHADSFDHEQSLVFDTERGLVIFNSCSHGGADNIIREVGKTWPDKNIYALFGGLHLFESSDEDVYALAERVRETGIEKIYTGHCTGDRAMEILKAELGEKVGQIYTGLEIFA